MADLNGCYFSKGPKPVFEIRGSKLLAPAFKAAVAISSNTSDSSVITFSPPIRVTENAQKAMIVVEGSETAGFAFKRGKVGYILLAGGGMPVRFEQRDCRI